MSNNNKNKKGFVLLFTIIILTIILSVSFGVSDIALKETQFSTSARSSNEAFYAADVGVECALFNDKLGSTSFLSSGGSGNVSCLNQNISFSASTGSSWSFVMTGLGQPANGCAKVTVVKDFSVVPITTVIDSLGYNTGDSSCNSTSPLRVERAIRVTY